MEELNQIGWKNLDILLIKPNADTGGYMKDIFSITPPMAYLSIAAYMRKFGIKIGILDAEIENFDDEKTLEIIKESDAKIIGLTAMSSYYKDALRLAKKIKEKFPNKKIVIGGVHISSLPKDVIKEDCFDFGIIGEGEVPFYKLADALLKKGDYKNIKGLMFKDKEKIIDNGYGDCIMDLDEIPRYAYDLIPVERYKATPAVSIENKSITMYTRRGCPFQCIFCASDVISKKTRAFSAKRVFEDILWTKEKYGIKEIIFWDDSFTIDRQRIIDLCNLIIENKLDIIWTVETRADLCDEELLRLMKKAGCWCIFFGVESGSDRVLKIIKKGETKEQIRKAFKMCYKLGIATRASFILGLPGDTKESMQESINFAKELNSEVTQFQITVPFPGSELFREYEKYGTIPDMDFSKWDYYSEDAYFIPNGLDIGILKEYRKKAYIALYTNPFLIMKRIMRVKSSKQFKSYVKGYVMFMNKSFGKLFK